MTVKYEPAKSILVDLDGVLRIWPDEAYLIEDSNGLPRGAIEKTAFAAPQIMPAISGISIDADWRRSIARELLRAHPQSDADKAYAFGLNQQVSLTYKPYEHYRNMKPR